MTKQTILLIEDNPDEEVLAKRALQQDTLNGQVIVAHNGAEAMAYLLSGQPLPTVILLDLKLPKIDGLQVLQWLRAEQRTRLLPVVVLTSSSEDQDLIDCYRLGANGYIRKPVNYDEFREKVHQLGMYWLKVNEAPPAEYCVPVGDRVG